MFVDGVRRLEGGAATGWSANRLERQRCRVDNTCTAETPEISSTLRARLMQSQQTMRRWTSRGNLKRKCSKTDYFTVSLMLLHVFFLPFHSPLSLFRSCNYFRTHLGVCICLRSENFSSPPMQEETVVVGLRKAFCIIIQLHTTQHYSGNAGNPELA